MEFIDDPNQDVNAPAPAQVRVTKTPEKKRAINSIPPGYIPVQLSSLGRFGVPETIHVKNFTTEFLVELAMASEEVLPARLISAVQSLIWEKGVLVERWPEKLVIELLLRIYSNFFTPVLASVNFPVLQADIDWLEARGQTQTIEDIKSGAYRPKTDLDLRKLDIVDLDPKIKDYVTFKSKTSEFSVKLLAYTKLNDSLLIKKAIDEKFGELDRVYAKLKSTIDLRSSLISQERYDNLPVIDPFELEAWQIHEAEKALYSLQIARAINLVEYNGRDISDLSIEEKVQLVEKDPLFDATLAKKIDEQAGKISFGVSPEVEVLNPITREVCKRNFTFRYVDILQAVQLSDVDAYDISYDD